MQTREEWEKNHNKKKNRISISLWDYVIYYPLRIYKIHEKKKHETEHKIYREEKNEKEIRMKKRKLIIPVPDFMLLFPLHVVIFYSIHEKKKKIMQRRRSRPPPPFLQTFKAFIPAASKRRTWRRNQHFFLAYRC